MSYEEFKTCLLEELNSLYGEAAVIIIENTYRNNSQHLEGICIKQKGMDSHVGFIVYLDGLYSLYQGGMTLEECVKTIYEEERGFEYTGEMKVLTGSFSDWSFVKRHVYPVLLSTKENQEMLKNLVSTPMLDLSIVYMIQIYLQGGVVFRKYIDYGQLSAYRISREGLHGQAMSNMEGEGYRMRTMEEMLKEMLEEAGCAEDMQKSPESREMELPMYVLTNRKRSYGAAGLLDRKLLMEFAGGRSFYILPSSVHEIIFVSEECVEDWKVLDCMIEGINKSEVREEDRLSDHSYYYDGESGEIRICA